MPSNPPESPAGHDQNPASFDMCESPPVADNDYPGSLEHATADDNASLGDRQFYRLFAAALDAMVIADDQGFCVAVNQSACELFGVAQDELLGCCIADFTLPGFEFDQVWQSFQQQGQERGEFSLVRVDGSIRQVEYAATANIAPHRHLAILRDVTERQQLEQQIAQRNTELQQANRELQQANRELQTNQQKYQSLFEILPIGVCITDATGVILEANPALEEILGITIADQAHRIDAPSWQTLRSDGSPMPSNEFASVQALRQHRLIHGKEKGILRGDGTIRWINVSAAPIPLDAYGVAIAYIDISDRKHSEVALQESEERLRVALEAARMGSWDWNIVTNQIIWSESLEHMMGMQPGMFDGRFETILAMIYPDDRPQFLATLNRSLAQDDDYTIEFRFVKPDGSIRWAASKGKVLYDASGQPVRMAGIDVDITDRKLAEIALQQALQELTHHIENSPLATIRWNQTFRVECWSKQAEKIFGWSADEVMGKTMYEWSFLFEDDLEHINQSAVQLLQGNSIVCHNRNYHKDGSVLHCEWYNSILLDEQGNLVSILSLAQDVSDRKRSEVERQAAELALRQSEATNQAIIATIPDLLIQMDRDGTYLQIHQRTGVRLMNAEHIQAGHRVFDMCPATMAEERMVYVHRALATNSLQVYEYEVNFEDELRYEEARIMPMKDETVLLLVRDITDRKIAEASLRQREQEFRNQSEREHSLRLITQHIRETLDLDDILATAVTEVQRLLQADRTLIFRLNVDGSGTVIQEAVRPGLLTVLHRHWNDECFPPECYATYCQRTARIVANVTLDAWSECLVEFMQQTGVQSKVVAPILQSQEDDTVRVWGLLIVHACEERRIWHADEAELLQQVADQLAIAIQQANLYNQVQQLNINLEQQVQDRTADLQQALAFEQHLKRITDQVRDSLDEEQILETAVQELAQGLQLECCDTGIYNDDLTTTTIAHEFTKSLISAKGVTLNIAETTHVTLYPFLFRGEILQFCDRIPCMLRTNQGQLTILACPILDDQRVWGDMWLYKQEPFSPAEVRLVQQVANQCAIALRQSRLYQAAQAQVRELERLHQLKDDFLSTVSHELRTPISTMNMAIQMLEISLQPLAVLTDSSQSSSRYFQILKTECQREIQLINDLLDLTHLDAGTEPLSLTLVDLRFLIPHIAEPFIERTVQHQQQFDLVIPEQLPAVMTDLFYLERIVSELLNNACKYTPAGECICLSIDVNPTSLSLVIRNSGVEISATECDRIFDKFYRIPNNDPWKYGGTGLGLALVKKLTERLGGDIRVISGDNQTTFILDLDLA